MANRRAFTLLELLVVISVIAVLAGLLIPTIGLVRHLVNDVKCGNNLQQIASAMEAYKAENTDQFPDHMIGDRTTVFGATSGPPTDNLVCIGGPLTGLAKVFRCPYDTLNGGGSDQNMGRGLIDNGGQGVAGLYDGGLIDGVSVFSSYCFEASGFTLDAPAGSSHTEDSSAYFTSSEMMDLRSAGVASPTMYMAKHNELLFGLVSGDQHEPMGGYPASQLPIIRCFFHLKWNLQNRLTSFKVQNVSWDLNVIKTIPYWETTLHTDVSP